MEKEEIRTEAPLTIAGVTLVPIVKVSLNYWCTKGRLSVFGTRRPVSVVVASPQTKRAFRVSGKEISLDQLIKEAPSIEETLEGI